MSYAPDMPIPEKDAENPAHVDAHGRLPEEVKFDKRVYGGISYFAQAGSGILLTHWIRHGAGRPIFDAMANWFGPKVLTKITNKTAEQAVKAADGWIVVSTMVMVGNLFLLPVKWLEDRKPEIVRGMTENSNAQREAKGETISPEERAGQEKYLTLLDKKPKQTWWSLGSGRAFALGAVYSVLYGIGHQQNPWAKNLTLNQWGENLTAETVQSTLDGVGLKGLAQSRTVENYTRISFYDMFYSAISAGGLYIYSHFIQPPKRNKLKQIEDPVLPPMEEAVLEAVDGGTPAGTHADNPTAQVNNAAITVPHSAIKLQEVRP